MRRLLSLFAILLFGSVSAEATSYVMMHDATLVDQAPEIVRVRIDSRENDPAGPRTLYRATVLETLKGSVGPEITLSVPGGTNDAGMTWKVFGVPSFEPGDEALVFASYRDDGTWSPFQLMLGTFHEKTADGERVALRDLSEATEMGRVAGAGEERARSSARFSRWIHDRLAGNERPADYFVERDEQRMGAASDAFSFIGGNPPIRFFAFDNGGTVPWRLNANGTALTPQMVKQGMNAWNSESQTPIALVYGGTSEVTNGLDTYDLQNVVLGGDPRNEISGSYSCGGGGVLAIGGPWFDPAVTRTFNGNTYRVAVNADIVTNNGTDCWFSNLSKAAQVLGHEFGHTLGLGHSCGDTGLPSCGANPDLNDALMRAFAHNDGRGAVLGQDDIAGIRSLYKKTTGGGGAKPAAPGDLTSVALSTTQIRLTWKDKSTNENNFPIEMRNLGSVFGAGASAATGDFAEIHSAQANQDSFVINGLDPANMYAFRVGARNTNGTSYSNEASSATHAVAQPCVEDAKTLCLNNDRFQVTATFETADKTGDASAQELTGDTGYFYFFNQNNVEVVIKALNNCNQSGFYWVFLSGLTDQGVTVVVMDSDTGKLRIYKNTRGVPFVFQRDFTAFDACG